jgi:AhpD family alkylhydroperoxidase
MHAPRFELKDANPRIYPLMTEFSKYLETCSIDPGLQELIKIRASQINGCAHCLDMHIHDALKKGETPDRIYLLSVWREAPYYTDQERAALELTEAVTRIADHGVPDAVFEKVRAQYSPEQIIDLLTAINVINSWNRYLISMGATAPRRAAGAGSPAGNHA